MTLDVVQVVEKVRPCEAVQVTEDNLDAIIEWSEGGVEFPLSASARRWWHVGDWWVKTSFGHGYHLRAEEFDDRWETFRTAER